MAAAIEMNRLAFSWGRAGRPRSAACGQRGTLKTSGSAPAKRTLDEMIAYRRRLSRRLPERSLFEKRYLARRRPRSRH